MNGVMFFLLEKISSLNTREKRRVAHRFSPRLFHIFSGCSEAARQEYKQEKGTKPNREIRKTDSRG